MEMFLGLTTMSRRADNDIGRLTSYEKEGAHHEGKGRDYRTFE